MDKRTFVELITVRQDREEAWETAWDLAKTLVLQGRQHELGMRVVSGHNRTFRVELHQYQA